MVEGGAVCLGDSEMSWNRSRCLPLGTCPWRKHWADNNQHEHSSSQAGSRRRRWRAMEEGGREGTHINKQVLPQAPSPTMTSFRRISAMATRGERGLRTGESEGGSRRERSTREASLGGESRRREE
jgi:hypothetical protein